MQVMDIYKSDFSKSVITGEPQEKPGKYDDVVLGFVANRDFGGDRTLERLALYERRFELSLYKTMKEFKKLQKDRKSEQAGATCLKKQTQFRCTGVQEHKSQEQKYALEKQSQSVRIPSFSEELPDRFEEDQYELSDFEKNKANRLVLSGA